MNRPSTTEPRAARLREHRLAFEDQGDDPLGYILARSQGAWCPLPRSQHGPQPYAATPEARKYVTAFLAHARRRLAAVIRSGSPEGRIVLGTLGAEEQPTGLTELMAASQPLDLSEAVVAPAFPFRSEWAKLQDWAGSEHLKLAIHRVDGRSGEPTRYWLVAEPVW